MTAGGPVRVAIVGAGIGGLASALALAGPGREVTIVERRTAFPPEGAGIQLSPNAARILMAWGLGPALARAAAEPDRVAIRALGSGRSIGSVELGSAMRERFGAPYWVVARADLHTILLDAVRGRPNIRLRVGRSLATLLDEPGQPVRVGLDTAGGGSETLDSDLVVAADGVRSRARALLGDRREPRYSGFTAYRAMVPVAMLPPGFSVAETGLWLGRARHVVHYGIAGGRSVNIVAVEGRRDAVDGWSAAESAARVLGAFASAAPSLRALLDAAPAWSAWSLFDLPARGGGSGRVALLGDAAHPVLPFLAQGGALAIEDAAILARCLAGAEPAEAITRYGKLRLPRVKRVQDEARRNGRTYHASGPLAWGRDLVMGRLGPTGMGERYRWLYGWSPEA